MTEEIQAPMDIGNFPRCEWGKGPIVRARKQRQELSSYATYPIQCRDHV